MYLITYNVIKLNVLRTGDIIDRNVVLSDFLH